MISEETINNIREFLALPDPVHYDLVCDTMKNCFRVAGEWKALHDNGTPAIDVHSFYRKNSSISLDPDKSSRLLQDIYKLLWQDIDIENKSYMVEDGWIQSDTMTSVTAIINAAMKIYDTLNTEKLFKTDELNNGKANKNSYQRYSEMLFMTAYAKNYKEVERFISEYNIDKLLAAYHTIGNYVPVPRPCAENRLYTENTLLLNHNLRNTLSEENRL